MCVVSNIGDTWAEKFIPNHPWVDPYNPYTQPESPAEKLRRLMEKMNESAKHSQMSDEITELKKNFESLQNEMRELKKLLIAAKKYDEATGQPNCEMDEKVKLIKSIAEVLGVDMSEVFK